MIKKIVIKDIASFDKDGVVFDNLQRVNVVYGRNGTGKTTMSRVLENGYAAKGRRLPGGKTLVKPWKYPTCEVYWSGKPVNVLVYNKDFKDRNLKETMTGVYTFGDETEKKEKRIVLGSAYIVITEDRMSDFVEEATNKVREETERIEQELRDKLWEEIYKPHEKEKKLLKGAQKKASFTERIREILREKRKGDLFLTKNEAKHNFWLQLALQSEPIVRKVEADLKSLELARKECERVYKEAMKERENLSEPKCIDDNVKKCLDSINKILALHGYTGFSLQPSPKKQGEFQIQREDGSYVKDTLSEGEASIITFLYFIQIVKGVLHSGQSSRSNVVVIDDPISSLDYAAIELVSTLTNELIKKARSGEGGITQIIVLTHNTSYLKELNVNLPRKNTHFWKLAKNKGASTMTACDKVNPVRCDYAELWSALRNYRNQSSEYRLGLPIQMRRIIDTYFLEYGKYNKKELYEGGYAKTEEDKEVVMALMNWIEEQSSGAAILGNSKWTHDKYMRLFQKFFTLMGHEEHYRMMMKCGE